MSRGDVKAEVAELRRRVNDWNLIGVGGLPEDEYDCLVGPLLSKLHAGASADELTAFLNDEALHHFGLSSAPADTERFARDLVAWFGRRTSPS